MIATKNFQAIAPRTELLVEPTQASSKKSPAWHHRFLLLLPDICRNAQLALRTLTSYRREEAIDEVVAFAFVTYSRLVELGQENLAYATPIARYAVAQYRAGRRVGVRANVRDVLSQNCQSRNQFAVERIDGVDRDSAGWQELLLEDKRFTPAQAATLRIDFRAWLMSLPKRNRQLAETLARGESTSGAARQFNLTEGRVSQLRRELHAAWRMFQGEFGPLTT